MDKVKETLRDSAKIRWLVLILISTLMFSTYYFQDFFSPLRELMEKDLGINSEEFGRIIGLTTIANMFGMIILGGIFLDKWGIRLAGLVFGGVATLGGIITALASAGVFGTSKGTVLTGLIIGRILFGSGLEVICVIVSKTVVKWFMGFELALAMAINVGFGRLGSALAIAISLDIAGAKVSPAVVFAAALIGISLLFFLVYLFFDIKLDKQTGASDKVPDPDEEFKFSDLVKLATDKSFIYITLLCVAFYSAVFPFIQYAPDLLVNKFGFTYKLPPHAEIVVFGSKSLGSVIVYLVVFIFALSVTLIPKNIKEKKFKIISVAAIITVFGILVFLVRDILAEWMKNGPKTASLIPLGTIIFTPIFGSIVDKKGKAASLMMLGSFLLIFAHVSLSIFNIKALSYMGLLSLGIAFSLVPAAMWPSVAKIVPQQRLGTAYASMFTVQNWGLGLFFWGIGALLLKVNTNVIKAIDDMKNVLKTQGVAAKDIGERITQMQIKGELPYYDYKWPILTLVFCGVISIFLAFMLKRADKEQGYGLEEGTKKA